MEIRLCSNCQGKGTIETRGSEGYDMQECTRCKGSGRLMTKTYQVELPFNSDMTQFHISERKILDAIKEIGYHTFG